jgi:hypothetical protein
MRVRRWAPALAALALMTLAGDARAQGVRFGLHANFGTGLRNGFGTTDGGDANLGGGARVVWELGLHHEGLSFQGSVDVFQAKSSLVLRDFDGFPLFETGGRYWEGNANATYSWGKEKLNFYVGLGANLANDTLDKDFITTVTDTSAFDIGGNILFGTKALDVFFAEARCEVRGGGQMMLTAGILLPALHLHF